jgi:predicted CoA-binding protein
MDETRLQELGTKLNNALLGMKGAEATYKDLQEIRDEVNILARHSSGCTAEDLADEEMENSTRVKLFWMTQDVIYMKVYAEASNHLAHFAELQR